MKRRWKEFGERLATVYVCSLFFVLIAVIVVPLERTPDGIEPLSPVQWGLLLYSIPAGLFTFGFLLYMFGFFAVWVPIRVIRWLFAPLFPKKGKA